MSNVIYLTAGQMEDLRIKRTKLEAKKADLYEQIRDADKTTGIKGSKQSEATDLISEYMKTSEDLTKIDGMLKVVKLVGNDQINLKKVDIGTRFYLEYPDGESLYAILVDDKSPDFTNVGGQFKNYPDLNRTITVLREGSPVGQAVFGHKEGESVTVKTPVGKIEINITAIEKNLEKYATFLAQDEKARSTESFEEAKDTNNRHAYTASQRQLIKDEITVLSATKSDKGKAARSEMLKKYLDNNDLVYPPKGDTVGIGSIITLIIKDGDYERKLILEMINEAVSTEVSSEYIERVSPLGSKLFGKKAGTVLTGSRTGKTVTIESVDNSRRKVKTYRK